jgi:hypothetical protein
LQPSPRDDLMMKRHNKQQKMDLRLKAEENRKAAAVAKNLAEREQMEKLSHIKFRIGLSYILKPPAKYSSFTVFLHVKLSEQEIRDRMMKGFGDI